VKIVKSISVTVTLYFAFNKKKGVGQKLVVHLMKKLVNFCIRGITFCGV
jgi:hypothetical protein